MKNKPLECRVVIRYNDTTFDLGMYDPVSGNYAPLGTHRRDDKDRIIRDLKVRIEREGHTVTFTEQRGSSV